MICSLRMNLRRCGCFFLSHYQPCRDHSSCTAYTTPLSTAFSTARFPSTHSIVDLLSCGQPYWLNSSQTSVQHDSLNSFNKTLVPTVVMCRKQPFCYRCGHERNYKLIDCGHSALCNADTAKILEARYVNGRCDSCVSIAKEALPPPKSTEAEKGGCCIVQ